MSTRTWPTWSIEVQSSPYLPDRDYVVSCEQCDWSRTYHLYRSAVSGANRHHRQCHQAAYENWARLELARLRREYEEAQS